MFFVVLRERPSVILDKPIVINNPRNDGRFHRIFVQNHLDPSSAVADGISYYEFVQESDIEMALGTVLGEIYYLSAIISCVSGISVAEPEPFLVFTTGARSRHEFIQYGDFMGAERATGRRESGSICDVALKIEKIEDGQSKSWLQSSLHAFKKAQVHGEDPYTHFILAWIALELLDRILEKSLCPESLKCSECGRQLKMTGRGLEKYLEEDEPRLDQLKQATNLRARILHRAEDFAEVRNEAIGYAPFLRDLYFDVVDSLTGCNLISLKREKPISRIGSQIVLRGYVDLPHATTLLADEINVVGLKEEDLPHFEIEGSVSPPSLRQNGLSESMHTYTIKPIGFPEGAVFTHRPQIRSQGLKIGELSITRNRPLG